MKKSIYQSTESHFSLTRIKKSFSNKYDAQTGKLADLSKRAHSLPRYVVSYIETVNGNLIMHDPRPKFSRPFSKKHCQTRLSRAEIILRGDK